MLFYNLFLLSIISIRYIIIDDRFARSANTYTTGFKGIGLNDAFLYLELGLIYVQFICMMKLIALIVNTGML